MPTPSGLINFSDIESEFGRNGSKSLGAYRISQSAGLYSNLPLDSGIPQSGSISFSQLRGKRLNIVLDISGGEEYRVNMRSKYDQNSGITVIGGFKSKPADPSQKRILVSVNKRIGSAAGAMSNVALRTGTWGTSASLEVLLGSNAAIFGAGGRGGDYSVTTVTENGTAVYASFCVGYRDIKGSLRGPIWCKNSEPGPPAGDWTSGWYPGNYTVIPYGKGGLGIYEARRNWSATYSYYTLNPGGNGTSALGIEYGTSLTNNGYIQCGHGGGGVGGTAANDPDKNQQDAGSSGGGGGGGAGLPIGTKGFGSANGYYGFGGVGGDGNDSTDTVRGLGGPGGSGRGAVAGNGGAGGDPSNAPQNGQNGVAGNQPRGAGGPAGSNGYGIIITSGASYAYSGSGAVYGGIQYNGSIT
jgi:hypothetical protein